MENQERLIDIWEKVLKKLEPAVPPVVYVSWFQSILPLQIKDQTLEICVTKNFIKEWIEKNYKNIIQTMLDDVTKDDVINKGLKIDIISLDIKEENIGNTTEQTLSMTEPTITIEDKNNTNLQEKITQQQLDKTFDEEIESSINNKYSFETFITGGSNNLAHAAAMAVSENVGTTYNPLFLYGGSGLGKTHLLHAIGNRIKKLNPKARVLYISSEKFTNELITSIMNAKTEDFRKKYRSIDCLLIDDIQFLSRKEQTQTEFFHTFNTLHEANKQIIMTSDRPPKEISELEERLRTRFEWGLITDVQAPDLETRIAILQKKAQSENIEIPFEVLSLIAGRIENNIRELEGAYTRVIAQSLISKKNITIEEAKKALKQLFPETSIKPVTIEKVQEVVAAHFKLKIEDLIIKKRTRNIAFPRQVAMFLCRELTKASLPNIGEKFGGRDHTTVLHAYDKIYKERSEDEKLDQVIKEIINKLQK